MDFVKIEKTMEKKPWRMRYQPKVLAVEMAAKEIKLGPGETRMNFKVWMSDLEPCVGQTKSIWANKHKWQT